jgi:hypothetical protein
VSDAVETLKPLLDYFHKYQGCNPTMEVHEEHVAAIRNVLEENERGELWQKRDEELKAENERLRSALDMHERAGNFAKIEAALAVLDERLRCGEIDADLYEDMSRALRGGDDE